MKLILSITLSLFLTSVSLLHGQAEHGFIEGENFKNAVVYKTVGGSNVVMDMFYPDAEKMTEANPWVVFIHGGGWAGGSIDDIYKSAFISSLKKLVNNGVVVASIGYRLAKSPVTSYESMQDCKDAARFLLQNAAEHKLHPENYAIWGGSAGGHLALVTGLVPDSEFPGDPALSAITPNYKGIVSFYPFTSCLNEDLRPGSIFEDGTLFDRLLGGSVEDNSELALALSPTEFLDKNSIPVLLVHGENDTTLPVINSTYMKEVAVENNADVELITVANAEHSFGGGNISPTLDVISNETIRFILTKFGYTEGAIDFIEPADPIEPGTPVFEPDTNKIYNIYNHRWTNRMGANGGDELIVVPTTEEGTTAQWKFTPVSGEEGFYYIDCIGGGAKPRISADATDVSKMVVNTEMGDAAKWKFDYTTVDLGTDPLFWISNKNGRLLRGWNDHVDVVNTTKNGSYTRYHFSESTESLGIDTNIQKENITIYPNPTNNIFTITNSRGAMVEVYNVLGRLVFKNQIERNKQVIDFSTFDSGVYFIKMNINGIVSTKKVVKN